MVLGIYNQEVELIKHQANQRNTFTSLTLSLTSGILAATGIFYDRSYLISILLLLLVGSVGVIGHKIHKMNHANLDRHLIRAHKLRKQITEAANISKSYEEAERELIEKHPMLEKDPNFNKTWRLIYIVIIILSAWRCSRCR